MKKKILSIFLSLSMLSALAVPAMAEEAAAVQSLAEDFESENFVNNEATAEDGTYTSDWYASSSTCYVVDKTRFHDGKQSLGFKTNWQTNISYRGDMDVGNYVYEVWYYDEGYNPSAATSSAISLSGIKSDGVTATGNEALMFGHKAGAYNGSYIVRKTNGSGITRQKGWHQIVIDTTTKGKVSVWYDGVNANSNNVGTDVYDVTGFKIGNFWSNGAGGKSNIDSIKTYNSYSEVPVHRDTVMESVKFQSGEDVEWCEDAVTSDGNIIITFSEDMVVPSKENFTLLKKAVSSESDAYYVTADVNLVSADAITATIQVADLEKDTTYRLGFTGLATAEGKTVATDFLEFSTYDDLTWDRTTPKGLIYEEDFDEELTDWILNGVDSSSTKAHNGDKALRINNLKQSSVNARYNGETALGNYVYSFWFYDEWLGSDFASPGSSGAALIDLTNTTITGDGTETTTKEKAMFGVKHNSYYGKYLLGATSDSGIARSKGWHYVVLDATTAGAVTVYVDGVKGNTKSISVNPVNGINIFSAWTSASASFYFDDLQVYRELENVPVYKSEIIDTVLFDNGVLADGAENIVEVSGNININYKKSMDGISADNFELLVRDNASNTDADFETAAFTLVSTDKTSTVISVDDLQSSKEYRLVMKDLTADDEAVMAEDYITFKTSDIVELEESVVDYVAFDNGARLPSTGIPETFGDLIVHFAMEMNAETLNAETVILKKADGTVIDVVANASGEAYTINSNSMGLEPSATYTLTVTTGAKTATGNYAYQDYNVSFTTSKDLAHQDVIFEDSFENGWNNWNRTGHNLTEDTYHTGNKALILSQNGYVQYNGTVPTNAVYEVWLYDGGLSSENIVLQLKGEQADGTTGTIQFGTKNGYGSQYWLSDLSDDVRLGTRSVGWHRFIVDFRNPDQVNYYIDDTLVAVRPEAIKKITDVRIRNQFSTGKMIADDFKIWNAVDYDVISKVYESKAFICDENYNALVDYKAGDKVYVAVNIDNQQADTQSAVLAVAEYKDGKLSKVIKGENTNILAGESVNLRVEYTIPESFEDYELKAFCWDSMETMKPIMPATDPKAVTAVFLGGSITAGTGATDSSKNYVSLTGEYLKSTYAYGSDVTIINSGVGGKGSAFGSKHFYNYVGKYNPDILFVEYAVNDRAAAGGEEEMVKKTLEQVVQKALALPKKPQIVFIYTTGYNLDSCTDWHNAVASHYEIPVIDLMQAVKTEIIGDEAAVTWANYGQPYLGDGVHPTDEGYAFYAEKIIEALSTDGFLKTVTDKEANFQ